MKKIIILLLCVASYTQVCPQKLIQKKTYWDIWETQLSLVWYETGDGIQHGEQKAYYQDGTLMSYKKYNMGTCVHSTYYDAAGNITRVGNWDNDGNIEGEQKEYEYSEGETFLQRSIFCKDKEVISYSSYYGKDRPKIQYEKNKFLRTYDNNNVKTSDLSLINGEYNGFLTAYEGEYYFEKSVLVKYWNCTHNGMQHIDFVPDNKVEGTFLVATKYSGIANKTAIKICRYKNLEKTKPLLKKINISFPDGNFETEPYLYEIEEKFNNNMQITSTLLDTNVECDNVSSLKDKCLEKYLKYSNGQKKFSGDTTFYESGKIKSLGNKLEYYESGIIKRNGDSLYFENGKMQTDGINTWFENGNPKRKLLTDRTEFYYESGKIKQMVLIDFSKYIDYYENGNTSKIWEKTTFNNNPCEITRTYDGNGNIKNLIYQDQSDTLTYSSEQDFEKTQIRNQLQSAYNDFTQTVLKELKSSLEMKGSIDFNRNVKGEISFNLSIKPLDKSIDPSITDKFSSCISKTITNKSVILPVYNNAYSFQEQISIQVVDGKEKVFVKSGKSLLSYGEIETESNNPKKVNTVCKNEIARKKIITDYSSKKAGVYKINYRTITINDIPSQIYLTEEKYKIHTVGGNILRYTGYTIALGVSLLLALAAQ